MLRFSNLPEPPNAHVRVLSGQWLQLLEPYIYYWLSPLSPTRNRWVIPKGFIFDQSSVPRAVWAVISPFDLGPACIIHDWPYGQGVVAHPEHQIWDPFKRAWRPSGHPWSRAEVDRFFLEMMRSTPFVPGWRREIAYHAVNLFGGDAFASGGPEVPADILGEALPSRVEPLPW